MADGYKGKPLNSIVMLILSLVCGLPALYWIWVIWNDLKGVLGKEVVSLPMLILGILCFPLGIYNMYLMLKAMPEVRQKLGQPAKEDNTGLMIVAAIFSIIGMFMIQEELNKAWGGAPGLPGQSQ